MGMGLVLCMKIGESIVINEDLVIMIVERDGRQVRLAIKGDPKKYDVSRLKYNGTPYAKKKPAPIQSD